MPTSEDETDCEHEVPVNEAELCPTLKDERDCGYSPPVEEVELMPTGQDEVDCCQTLHHHYRSWP